jgi:hypothetical protein
MTLPPGAGAGAGSSVAGNGGYGASVAGNGGFGAPAPSMPAPPAGGYPVNSQYQGQSPMPVANGFNNPGLQGNPDQQMLAQRQINALLTSPRPGGPPTVGGSNTPGIGGSVQGGLAGVASTFKGHGIKRYRDQDEYQKWEFYYDFGGDIRGAQQNAAAMPQQNNANGTSGFGGSTGSNSGVGGSGFGATGSSFGSGGSSFGAGSTGSFGSGATIGTPPTTMGR